MQSKWDNAKRGIRTGVQALIGFLVLIPILDIWNNYVTNHEIHDPTVKMAIGVVLAAFVAWLHNAVADKTGHDVLKPADRLVGDAELGTGLGAKQGAIVTTPVQPPYDPNNP